MFEEVQLPILAKILAAVYVSIFLIDKVMLNGELLEWGNGKSFNNLEKNEWYRQITGTFYTVEFYIWQLIYLAFIMLG